MRARKVCSNAQCGNLMPCAEHTPAPWSTSTRKQHTTLSGWAQQKRAARIIKRDQTICGECGRPAATECDHRIPLGEGGADTDDNCQAIHADCHKRKTEREREAGRTR